VYDFAEGTAIPPNLVHWRVPREGTFSVASGGGGSLQIVPSRNNLTGTPFSESTPELSGQSGLAFIGRRQTDSLFDFSVDLSFTPQEVNQEAGVTVFLTQVNHIDLGVVLLEPEKLSLRFRAEGTGGAPEPVVAPVPADWADSPIRLRIQAANATHYTLGAMSASRPNATTLAVVGTASAALVSGGNGSFVGSLVGAYATCNGAGSGVECPAGGEARFGRWRYTGVAQYITEEETVPSW